MGASHPCFIPHQLLTARFCKLSKKRDAPIFITCYRSNTAFVLLLINPENCMLNKFISFYIITIVLFSGCQEKNKKTSSAHSYASINNEATRDYSINKSNAYNDIFLDSADVEKFIIQEKLNDSLSASLRAFYNVRNFEYSWFTSTGLVEQAFSFHNLCCTDNEKDVFSRSLEKRMDKLRVPDDSIIAIDPKDAAIIQTELQITEKFIQFAIENYKDKELSAADLGTFIPAKKIPILALADSVTVKNKKNQEYDGINRSFKSLKDQLQKYSIIAKSGGWPTIVADSKKYSKGMNGIAVAAIKKRLQITGELAGMDTTDVFNSGLETAVKMYQQTHGFKPTGAVTTALIKDMNVPVLTRIQQLLINLQRMRWMPTNITGRLILINIPEFELYVDSAKATLFQMDVIVGAEGHNTTMFSGNLNQVVFSPYWNVPASIVKKEVLPGMKRNKNYLKEKDMEITGQEGGLPVVRQLPGPKNSLGKVKFLFPNSFDIYLHDTPDRDLFKRSTRDFSHGCIRLSDPSKMARYLLQNSKIWTPEKIDSAMNCGAEEFVRIKDPVPVMITYYTSWVDNNNVLHFADDIYGHDSKMAAKMFSNPQ